MANIYLQIDYSTGSVYQYSKEQKENYEKHTNSKGVDSWRKVYSKGLYGKLESVSLRDSNFGKEVSIAVKDKNGDSVFLNTPLFDAKKNLASYAESFITVLPNLKVGQEYRFYPYNIKEEGQKYSKVGISVVPANIQEETVDKDNAPKKLTYTYTKNGEEVKGDIPAVLWEEDFDGSRSMNAKAKNKYLYDVLLANISTSNQPQEQPTQKQETKTNVKKDEGYDNLPF